MRIAAGSNKKESLMRRGVGAFLAVVVLAPLVVAANASAQGATLRLNPSTAAPGQAVAVTSSASFSSAPGTSAVSIRLSTRDGRVLASTSPDARGRINATFPVPSGLSPGAYLIVATQTNAMGRQQGFTPGRAVLRVPGSSRASTAPPPGGSTGGGPPAQLPVAAVALALLAGGCLLIVRRLRMVNRSLGS